MEKPKTSAYRSTKVDKTSKALQIKASHIRQMRMWHVCLPIHKFPEETFGDD